MFTAQMKGRVSALLIGLAAAVAATASGQDPVNQYGNPFKHPPKPTTAAITAEELRTRLYIFADDSMQGRRVATVGNMKGTDYIASELKRLGVEPAGDNGGFFQRLPYVTRKFTSASTLTAGGTPLAFNTDFVPTVGAATRAPKAIANVPVIYGGIEGDTTKQITPAEAAGKFVIMSPGAPGQGGGRAAPGGLNVTFGAPGGVAGGGAGAALPAGCPAPGGGGRAGGGGGGGGGGGRGGAGGGGGVSAATVARYPDAIAIAVVDLDNLTTAQRAALNNPLTASPAAAADAKVPTPNPAFQGAVGDIVVTNGTGGVAVIRGGQLIAGTLAAGQTPASVQAKLDALAANSRDSSARVAERRDTLVAAATRFLAANYHGSVTFRGETVSMDSAQVVALACAPAGGGRGGARGGGGGAGGRITPPAAGAQGAAAGAAAAAANGRGNGRGGNGGRGRGGAAGAAAADPTAPVATIRLTNAAAAKLLGKPIDGLAAGTAGATVTGSLTYVEEPSNWARNVVGIVRGSDPKLKGEYVAIGAHNDHNGFSIGGARDHDSLKAYNDAVLKLKMQQNLVALTPAQTATVHVNMDSIRKLHPVPRLDSIQNGADDDGSGSMGVLEIAEAVAKMPVKPKRSIIFVWHTGEESGLLGSRYFTANPTVPIDSVVAQINIDMIGRGRAEDMIGGGPTYLGAVGSKRMSTDLNKQMLAVNAKEAKPLNIDYRFDDATLGVAVDGKPVQWAGYNNIYGRSDHAHYAEKCIPIVFFFTGLHGDYHQITDEPQYIDYPHYSMIDNYIKELLVDVANRPIRPALDNPCVRR